MKFGYPVDYLQAQPGRILELWSISPVGAGVEIGKGSTPMKEEDLKRPKTDAAGVVRLPIDHGGLQLIAVDYATPARNPEAVTTDSVTATLTLTLK